VAVGSYNLENLTTGQSNTAIGQGLMHNLTTGSSNVALGYEAGSSYESNEGFQMGNNNITIGNFARSGTDDVAVSNNIYIGPSTATSATGVSNSIMLGTGAASGVSNEFMINNIHHLNIPALNTNADWVEALGRTYNLVEKIDTAISTINSDISTLQSNSSVTSTGLFTPTFSSATNVCLHFFGL